MKLFRYDLSHALEFWALASLHHFFYQTKHVHHFQIRRLWSEELYIPGIPLDEIPDLKSCRLYQQLQVVNSCVSRKKWRTLATQSIESVMRHAGSCSQESADLQGTVTSHHILYARISTGELVLRLGADRPAHNLTMLETGEPVYSPITQVWLVILSSS